MEPLKALLVIRKPSIYPRAKPASADRSITVRSDAFIYINKDINAQTYGLSKIQAGRKCFILMMTI